MAEKRKADSHVRHFGQKRNLDSFIYCGKITRRNFMRGNTVKSQEFMSYHSIVPSFPGSLDSTSPVPSDSLDSGHGEEAFGGVLAFTASTPVPESRRYGGCTDGSNLENKGHRGCRVLNQQKGHIWFTVVVTVTATRYGFLSRSCPFS